MSILQSINDYFKSFYERKIIGYSTNQYFIIFVVCSMFLPYYIGFIAMGIVCIYLITTKQLKNIIQKTPKGSMVIVFSIYTTCVSFYHGNNIGMIQGVGLLFIGMFIMFYRENVDERLFTCIIDICCLASICCFMWGILEYLSIIDRLGQDFSDLIVENSPKNRVNSTFYNANFYAQVIQFFVLMCIYKILNTKKKHRIIFYTITILCNLFALYLTGCRTGWLSFLITIPFMFYVNNWKKTSYSMIGIIVLELIILLLNPTLFPRFETILSSFMTRVNIWKTAILGIKENFLFGLGIGGYILIYNKFGGHPANHSHSIYLDPFLTFGIVGVILSLTFIIPIFKEILMVYKKKIDMKLVGLIICFVITILVHGIFNVSIMWSQSAVIFLLILNGYKSLSLE